MRALYRFCPNPTKSGIPKTLLKGFEPALSDRRSGVSVAVTTENRFSEDVCSWALQSARRSSPLRPARRHSWPLHS
jgi:hypothetical protein